MSPYVVTTKLCDIEPSGPAAASVSRRAVATLEEARAEVWDESCARQSGGNDEAWDIPESGGTVGPLPDGTLIEVEDVSLVEMYRRAGFDYLARENDELRLDQVIEAFSAQEAAR